MATAQLPAWVTSDAKLVYVAFQHLAMQWDFASMYRARAKLNIVKMDDLFRSMVGVEMSPLMKLTVETSTDPEVTIVFARDGKSEMQVPFSQILGEKSPLKLPELPDLELLEDETEKFFDSMEGTWFGNMQNLDPKVALGSDKGKFSFEGPAAPPLMEVMSSPEMDEAPQRRKKEGKKPKEAKELQDSPPTERKRRKEAKAKDDGKVAKKQKTKDKDK
ncbi:rpsL [Symbiodinium sp. CCMP2592]|nr:rpsL [Symbiodinium sp. CCMP2592]